MFDVTMIVAALLISFAHVICSNDGMIKYRLRESTDFKISQLDKTGDDVYNHYFDYFLDIQEARLKECGDSVNMRHDTGRYTDPEETYYMDFMTTSTVLHNISSIQRITNVSVESLGDEKDTYFFRFSVKFPDAKATSNFFMRQNDGIHDSWEGTTSALVGDNTFDLWYEVNYVPKTYGSINCFQSSFRVTESNVTWTYQEGEDKWVDYAVEHALMFDGDSIFLALPGKNVFDQIGVPIHP